MANMAMLLTVTFVGALFLLFNGPIWMVTRAGLFSRGRQAPARLETVERWLSHLAGLVVLLYWTYVSTRGSILAASLLSVTFLLGLFLLMNGPVLIVTRSGTFARGREVPSWLEMGLQWFHRVVGGAVMLSVLLLGIRYMLIVSGS